MPFNENFVVRNGLEVASNLIYADYITNKVGIGTTALIQTLTVNGDIGAKNITISGISTVSQLLTVGLAGTVLYASSLSGLVGVGTANPQYILDVRSPVSTGQTALYVQGDSVITGNLQATNITFNDANLTNLNVTGIASISSGILTSLSVSGVTTLGVTSATNLNVSGDITSGSINAGSLNVSGISSVPSLYSSGIISANNFIASGISTLGITSVTNLFASGITTLGFVTATGLYVSGASTVTGIGTFSNDLYVGGSLQVAAGSTSNFNGDVNLKGYLLTIGQSSSDEVVFNSVITSGLIPRLDLQYDVGSPSKRWRSFYGDGSNLTGIATNLTATIGVASESTFVGSGVTTINFKSTTGTAVDVVSSGTTATVTITPGVSLGLAIALGG